jgi:hypothetical protein
VTQPKIPLHRNTDSEKTGVIPPVQPAYPAPKTHPLTYLAFVVFLASANAALWMSSTPVPLNVFLTGTSIAALLVSIAGANVPRKDKR